MKLSNNLNILPWLESIELQNHRKDFAQFGIFQLLAYAGKVPPFQLKFSSRIDLTPDAIYIYAELLDVNGVVVNSSIDMSQWVNSLRKIDLTENFILINDGIVPLSGNVNEGKHYIKLSVEYEVADHVEYSKVLYSEVFNITNSLDGYLRLDYWDNNDFQTTDGFIIYAPPYINYVYLQSQLGKPEYPFEEEVTKRDGYSFVEKQISSKKFKFEFIAPEFLCDALRVVRMHDNIKITNVDNIVYDAESILFNPKWQESGDIAVVEAEFDCDTVVKKIGKRFKLANGDFNTDFNLDFTNGSI